MARTHFVVAIVSVVVVGLVVAFALTTSMSLPDVPASDNGIGDYSCQPVDISKVRAEFPIRGPLLQSMPQGYALQLEQDQQGRIVLYYSDHSIPCPLPIDKITQFIENGTIAVAIDKASNSGYSDSEAFQTGELQYYTSKEANVTDARTVDINGFKGVAASHAPTGQTSVLFFYHGIDQTIYGIYGTQTVQDLVTIARSIPHS
jgi:hypothetical protein